MHLYVIKLPKFLSWIVYGFLKLFKRKDKVIQSIPE